ncbi:MAG TPA: hypothetical protein VGQ53_00420 [Chitinophagaceae bacterium]|nr:hypothetical protein [Chitinophagaceae bacterium]
MNQILQTLETQLNQRLEKLWRVFTWCSSILITITGGVILAARTKEKSLLRFPQDPIIISSIIVILTIYSWLWIRENLKMEKNIRDLLDKMFEELNYPQLKTLRPDKARFGYKHVILLLGLLALAATWVDYLIE